MSKRIWVLIEVSQTTGIRNVKLDPDNVPPVLIENSAGALYDHFSMVSGDGDKWEDLIKESEKDGQEGYSALDRMKRERTRALIVINEVLHYKNNS